MAKIPDSSAQTTPAPGATMVIFGAWGDLTKRLLIPALYNLAKSGLLDPAFKVVGVDHNDGDDEHFREGLGKFMRELASDADAEGGEGAFDAAAWKDFSARLFYQVADFEDDASYQGLGARLDQLGGKGGGNVLFYLAVSPHFFGDIVERLAKSGLTHEPAGAFRRVVIEKPFGSDLASAKALNARILKCLEEQQIYRIDHFLGKETVRNIMALRFANGVFEPLWNRLHIDHVQITAAETVGVEERGAFYEETGALRDMIPNHLFQILAMVTMEAPNALDAESIRAEKARVIQAIEIQTPAQALADSVRGQYHAGVIGHRQMKDYRQEDHVARTSRTETYVALKLTIDSWRWAGVPFYLRTGKAMGGHKTEVVVQFKPAPLALFKDGDKAPPGNALLLHIQPHEGVALEVQAKQPGPEDRLDPVRMDFRYSDYFQMNPSTGYETLIYDCLIGDQTLFKRADDIEFAWAAVQPFLDAWAHGGELNSYDAGSEGPAAADRLLARDGRAWRSVKP